MHFLPCIFIKKIIPNNDQMLASAIADELCSLITPVLQIVKI